MAVSCFMLINRSYLALMMPLSGLFSIRGFLVSSRSCFWGDYRRDSWEKDLPRVLVWCSLYWEVVFMLNLVDRGEVLCW